MTLCLSLEFVPPQRLAQGLRQVVPAAYTVNEVQPKCCQALSEQAATMSRRPSTTVMTRSRLLVPQLPDCASGSQACAGRHTLSKADQPALAHLDQKTH